MTENGVGVTPGSVNRQWLLAKRPGTTLLGTEFRWAESAVPSPGEGQALVQNLWLSLAPTAILFTAEGNGPSAIPLGGVMRSPAAAAVVESRLPGIAAGDLVEGWFGWEDYSLTDGKGPSPGDLPMTRIARGVAPNLALDVLGINGMAAYFGLLDVGQIRPGETVVISSAAGGVGSIAGQIAKIGGCRVVGISSGADRCRAVRQRLGFDAAIDRRTEDVGARLSALCPEGIDVYFDNSGLPAELDLVYERLARRGRVVLCGATSVYLANELPPGPKNTISIILRRGRVEGLLAREYADRFPEASARLTEWMRTGRLVPFQDVLEGLENAPRALAACSREKTSASSSSSSARSRRRMVGPGRRRHGPPDGPRPTGRRPDAPVVAHP